jgi:hypothetical protein
MEVIFPAKQNCESCGLHIESGAGIRGQGVAGAFCNTACLEAVLFGTDRCRWCGSKMGKTYTSIDSRLCSEDCTTNYYAHVMGDRTAVLGSGVRFIKWLQMNRHTIYQDLLGQSAESSSVILPMKRRGRPEKPLSQKRAANAIRNRRYRESQKVAYRPASVTV